MTDITGSRAPITSAWQRWRRFGDSTMRTTLSFNKDFREFFESLNATGARYLVVGGYAVALHGRPISFIDREDLIRDKRAAGRLQDLADAEHLA